MLKDLIPFSRRTYDLERLFENVFNTSLMDISSKDIKVDIKETDNEYFVEAELPGVNKEQINIDYQNSYLTIAVENKEEYKEEKENYIRRERRYGSVKRAFYVENIDEENIEAQYKDGILKIKLPKIENPKKNRRIEIN